MAGAAAANPPQSFLTSLGPPSLVASTVPTSGPAAGDQNPYGVAVVSRSVGDLVRDDVLVSNFNAANNLQGTGSTIMQVDPASGTASIFAQIDASAVPGCTGGVGLTTALAVLRQGWGIVGSLPVSHGGQGSPAAGCLIVLDSHGTPVEHDGGATLFVTNVLDGIGHATPTEPVPGGTVVRVQLDLGHATPQVTDIEEVADGISIRPDPAALVVGPTGVGVEGDTLYVADSVNSQILAVSDPFNRMTPAHGDVVSSGGDLNDPLGMVIAPNGNIVTMNGGDGSLFVAPRSMHHD